MDGDLSIDVLPRPPRSDPMAAPEARYRSSMLRRFGCAWYLLGLAVLLRRLRMQDESAEHVRRAAERGPLVYVLHTRSQLDWLALNRVLNGRKLPLARFANGIRSTWLRPLWDAIREATAAIRLRLREGRVPDPIESGWLADAVARAVPALVFLVTPPRIGRRRRDGGSDPVQALIDAQARTDRPIQLVPVVVVWKRSPEPARSEVGRFLLGAQDEPGPLQKLWSVATRNADALVQAGEPIDLKELCERTADEPPARRVRILRLLLRRYLYRESHVIRGPRIRPYRWTRRLVLQSPEVRQLIDRISSQTGEPPAKVRARVESTLDRMSARFSFPAVRIARHVTNFVWNRIFSGIDFPAEDIERIRAALRAGTPILVPSHRSHLDYLLMSSQLYEHDVVIPHIVAGENLSFWPLGAIFRRLGAFFIKRTFRGDPVFPVVFERYLRQLIRDGFPIEFFIEGGRSRTGKLLPPKLGVLGMVMDAAWGGREDREVTLLPIAISYEQIAEESAYARELAGGSKKKEDIGQVVKASRVIRKRYGRVFIRVGEPITTREVFESIGRPWSELDRDRRREVLQHTGERLMYRIASSMVALPTGIVAMALLAHPRRGIRRDLLMDRVRRLNALLRHSSAVLAVELDTAGWAIEEALKRFEREKMLQRLPVDDGEILRIVDDKRITLEYYKNGIIHFVAPASLMAAALRAFRGSLPADHPRVVGLFRTQIFLFRYEFTFDPEVPLEDLVVRTRQTLVRSGALDTDGRVADRQRIVELAEVTCNFLESYLLVLRGARVLQSRDIPIDDLPDHIQEVGRGMLAVDEITRPEALSIVNLRNAVRAFREEGVLTIRSGGGGLQFDADAWAQYARDMARLLGRRVAVEGGPVGVDE